MKLITVPRNHTKMYSIEIIYTNDILSILLYSGFFNMINHLMTPLPFQLSVTPSIRYETESIVTDYNFHFIKYDRYPIITFNVSSLESLSYETCGFVFAIFSLMQSSAYFKYVMAVHNYGIPAVT